MKLPKIKFKQLPPGQTSRTVRVLRGIMLGNLVVCGMLFYKSMPEKAIKTNETGQAEEESKALAE